MVQRFIFNNTNKCVVQISGIMALYYRYNILDDTILIYYLPFYMFLFHLNIIKYIAESCI